MHPAAVPCRIEESGLVEACVRVCSTFLREQQTSLKLASARAASYLILAELQGVLPRGAALSPLVGVLVALLGQEQASEVQRLGLQVSTVRPPCHVWGGQAARLGSKLGVLRSRCAHSPKALHSSPVTTSHAKCKT